MIRLTIYQRLSSKGTLSSAVQFLARHAVHWQEANVCKRIRPDPGLFGSLDLYTVLGHKPHLYQKLGPAAVALACLLLFRCGAAARETAAISIIGLLAGLYESSVLTQSYVVLLSL